MSRLVLPKILLDRVQETRPHASDSLFWGPYTGRAIYVHVNLRDVELDNSMPSLDNVWLLAFAPLCGLKRIISAWKVLEKNETFSTPLDQIIFVRIVETFRDKNIGRKNLKLFLPWVFPDQPLFERPSRFWKAFWGKENFLKLFFLHFSVFRIFWWTHQNLI